MNAPELHPRWVRLPPERRFLKRPYPVVALTGGVASGKSTVARYLASKGVPTVSADALVKDVYALPETLAWLARTAPDMLGPDGKPDFPRLRKRTFEDADFKRSLSEWIYPRLAAAFERVERAMPQTPSWLVYEIPLLYELGMENLFDAVVVSWAPRDTQRTRLLKRDGCAPEVADAMLDQQMPLDAKKSRADLVYDNSAERAGEDEASLGALWASLTG